MRHDSLTHSLWTILALGCAAGPGRASAPQAVAESAPELVAPPWERAAPLRFGDPGPAPEERLLPGDHDPDVPPPSSVLGAPVGQRPAHPAEILAYFRLLAERSPRVRLFVHGRTHEGRELVHAVVTSEANHARLDDVRAALARLADPRGLDAAEEARLVRDTPACAWLGYSIHGDEISGADASMAVAYRLAAGTDGEVTDLLDDLVVVIDPVMNPDGRERFVSQLEQTRGLVPNRDWSSMQRGRWPEGRGNHYLFDMNRDWMAGVAPETRGRWRAARSFHPQLFVDAHEMGPLDTYLFYPQSPAFNPFLPATTGGWQSVFGRDQAAAHDARGWSYYTREWADAWGPFYSDAWGSLSGAVGILYEQASSDGQPVMRASGEVVPYRRSVERQAVSSLANLRTLRAHREDVLRDFAAGKRANLEVEERWFVLRPGANRDREDFLLSVLLGQGIEVFRAGSDVDSATSAVSTLGERSDTIDVPPDALLVPARQPLAPLVLSYLSFDVRMGADDLRREREDLERKGESRIYDVTAWSLPLALDVDAFWVDGLLGAAGADALERVADVPLREGAVIAPPGSGEATAWAVDGSHDSALAFAVAAMERGLAVHLCDEPFTTAGRAFPRGSLLVRRHENDVASAAQRVLEAARAARVTAFASASALSPDEGPDLGGQHFALLARPRVAVLANSPVERDSFGHLWHLLDRDLGVPYSMLDASSFPYYDLRRFNVLVLPPAGPSLRAILEESADDLRDWIAAGGTLVACGESAAMVADADLDLCSTRLRRDVLDELPKYAAAAERERAAWRVEIDEGELWGDPTEDAEPSEEPEEQAEAPAEPPSPAAVEAVAEEEDGWMRRFAPQGAFVRGEIDPLSWLTQGLTAAEMPVWVAGPHVLMARPPVRTAVRLAPASSLRLSGLLWPEARQRLADSAWATVERRGRGQVVLFAALPGFRGYCKATGRLLGNAVVLGPGAGASQPIGW